MRYHEKLVLMPSAKYEGLSDPTHFFKSRDSVNRNHFLNTELHKPHFLRDEMILCNVRYK